MVLRTDITQSVNLGDQVSFVKAKEVIAGSVKEVCNMGVGTLANVELEVKMRADYDTTISNHPVLIIPQGYENQDDNSSNITCSSGTSTCYTFVQLEDSSDDCMSSAMSNSAHGNPKNPVEKRYKTGVDWTIPLSQASGSFAMKNSQSLPAFTSLVKTSSTFIPVIRSGGSATKGNREYMEDVHILIDDLSNDLNFLELMQPTAFYGVFDGHGGSYAADFASKNLLRNILNDPAFPHHLHQALRCGFQRTDRALHQYWCQGNGMTDSGTTALVAFVAGGNLTVANAGDCRAVLSRKGKVVELSVDQKPKNAAERARIEAAGGYVEDDYLNGLLSVSRALGDWWLKSEECSVLISEPEVREMSLTEEDEFLLVACDGLWDVFTSQNAIDFARRELQSHNDPRKCSDALVQEALRRRSMDNLTVLTVCFRTEAPPKLSTSWCRRPASSRRVISSQALCALQGHLDV